MKASLIEGVFLTMTFLSYLLILSTPFLLSRFIKTNKFFLLLFVSIVLTFILSAVSTYWSEDLSDKLMYILYSFDDSGMSDEERLRNVNEENRTTIQEIYNRSFGIAWPLKLLMMYVILLIPYNVVSCGLIYLFKRIKQSS